MNDNFDKALKFVLASEGGFINHPQDPGGMTNLGVTKRAWEAYTGRAATEADMRALTPAIVAPFYKINYWNKAKCPLLPAGLDYMVFDAAVNMGVHQAVVLLQRACGIPDPDQDGAIGPQTLAAIEATPNVRHAYSVAKEAFYRSLKTFPVFGKGWLNRIAEVERNADTFT